MLAALIRFSLERKLVVFIAVFGFLFWGISVAPFDWKLSGLPRSPVPVDAIPDIGENQQIVFTDWKGRSPQDVEDQITYPLTVSLMGIPGVKTIRSYSYFGYSSVYIIFDEKVEFYWSRSRILEKLNSLPPGILPDGVQPALGPDATALGQVYWYTLEGLDSAGNPTGGWDQDELRSINDFYVRYALQAVKGVAEVASAGGMVREYQVDVDPDKLRHFGVTLEQVYKAVREANQEVGARTIEINRVEYVLRARGYVNSVEDLRQSVVARRGHQPVTVGQLARVQLGPAPRRGGLDKGGAEAVGGVVVVRYGENPLAAIDGIKEKLAEIGPGLPTKILDDGTLSRVSVVPFYDRSGLIHETLETLNEALSEEILVTVIVILFMLGHFRSSLVISLLLPLAVLICFVAMKMMGVDANVVALSGIAIAIGTMVDMGIIISENIVIHLKEAPDGESKSETVFKAVHEVAAAVVTAVMTTVVSFIPVFTMTAAEGKLFRPLAFTKTFALAAALLLSLFVIPPLAAMFFGDKKKKSGQNTVPSKRSMQTTAWFQRGLLAVATISLSHLWVPLGPEKGVLFNLAFVTFLLFGTLWMFRLFIKAYPPMLGWCLSHKALFLSVPLLAVLGAGLVWKNTGSEFMPSLDEGSYLLMPTTMPHASYEEAREQISIVDQMLESIPEVENAVGKLGRAESSLDPAPISMYEVVINYRDEWGVDSAGNRVRQWRDHIKSPDDIWKEIVKVVKVPGMTSAPKLMPIAARIIMLQSGMRAPMGIKVKGPDLKTIEDLGLKLEKFMKKSPGVEPATVVADRIVGKPYLEFNIDRKKAAHYGLTIGQVQRTLMTALGGRTASWTVEGRERYPIRVRYMREDRDNLQRLESILITSAGGAQIPVSQVANVEFTRGPMVIKSEDGFLVGYVVFDKEPGLPETDVVEMAQDYLQGLQESGDLVIPAGVSYVFTGNYENQIRARKTLSIVLPIALLVILLILYLQFSSLKTTMLIFTGIIVAWAGGFLLIGLYNTDWFMNFTLFGIDFRSLFQIRTVNLSIAVWVGFIALFGIASDNGVVLSEYLKQRFSRRKPKSVDEIRQWTLEASTRRIRPCLMTTATTLLALIPVLTSTGRGSDIMLPMSIPSFGGMLVVLVSVFIVPVLWSWFEERAFKSGLHSQEEKS